MEVKDSKGQVICADLKICKSTWSKARGLMFSRPKNLLFSFKEDRIVPLHMMFVFFPIDVYFLDKEFRIVELKENFRPFTFYSPKTRARYVLETQEGTIRRMKSRIGEKIFIQGL